MSSVPSCCRKWLRFCRIKLAFGQQAELLRVFYESTSTGDVLCVCGVRSLFCKWEEKSMMEAETEHNVVRVWLRTGSSIKAIISHAASGCSESLRLTKSCLIDSARRTSSLIGWRRTTFRHPDWLIIEVCPRPTWQMNALLMLLFLIIILRLALTRDYCSSQLPCQIKMLRVFLWRMGGLSQSLLIIWDRKWICMLH